MDIIITLRNRLECKINYTLLALLLNKLNITNVINLTFICLINYILFDCNKVGRKLRWSLKEFDLT